MNNSDVVSSSKNMKTCVLLIYTQNNIWMQCLGIKSIYSYFIPMLLRMQQSSQSNELIKRFLLVHLFSKFLSTVNKFSLTKQHSDQKILLVWSIKYLESQFLDKTYYNWLYKSI